MPTIEVTSFNISELANILKGVDPTAFLVPARVLRRVIKRDRRVGGLGFAIPHRKSCIIDRESLLQIADRAELGVTLETKLPADLILLARPEVDSLAALPAEQTLFKYWRLLYHARLDLAMQQKLGDGTLTEAIARQHIARLGITEFAEIAAVMRQEKFLLPPETPEAIFAEFVAVYLTMRHFTPALLPRYFPSLRDLPRREKGVRNDLCEAPFGPFRQIVPDPFFTRVDELIAEEIDGEAILAASRLPGAPDPDSIRPPVSQADSHGNLPAESIRLEPAAPIANEKLGGLEARATELDAKGNNVRAAILRTRAADSGVLTTGGGRAELSRLSQRLQKTLDLAPAESEQWRHALLPLLPRASRGLWSQEARFLYDLQKACLDSERGIFTIDPVEWVLSLGRRPLTRPLPAHQVVAIVRHLRQALHRMRYVRVSNGERTRLVELLENAVENQEKRMRNQFRPLISSAMKDVGLKPQNVPEELGRDKLIEELLDRVVDYGHLNMGSLRDAISRNQLKLADLDGPVELTFGDPLIHLNRRMAVVLDGVYRRGEIYMRLLHRISSVAFGTALGRLLMLYLVLPFGLGFLTMATPGLVVEEGARFGRKLGLIESKRAVEVQVDPDTDDPEGFEHHGSGKHHSHTEHRPLEMPNPFGVGAFSIFYLLLFHVAGFRSSVFYGVGKVGQGFQTVFIRGPLWILHLPALQAILQDRFWEVFRRFVFWPLLTAAVGAWIGWLFELDQTSIAWIIIGSWLVTIMLLNSRLGRDLEETTTDWLMYSWLWFSIDFVPGLFRLIMDLFRRFLEAVEQVIYTVDEWLRFKSGESLLLVAAKGVLSVIWFAVTYVVRIYINLLAEPTLNPIKHFPVVTFGHKVMLPFLPDLGRFLYRDMHLDILGPALGYGFVVMTILFIPGICGFAVWELKENWKLYRANRSRQLKPVMIGHHGETMLRLLKPGFHSGTIPKLFRKLRKAERRGQSRNSRKYAAGLHHVATSVSHFVERELLALLRQSKGWNGVAIGLTAVHLATNRVAVELGCPELGRQPLVLGIDHQHGWLIAGVLQSGWLQRLSSEQRRTLTAGLAGLYKLAGVDLTREQMAASLAPVKAAFEITEDGLVAWSAPEFTSEAAYDLAGGPILQPEAVYGEWKPLNKSRLLFSDTPILWEDWVQTWDRDRPLLNGDRSELAYAILP